MYNVIKDHRPFDCFPVAPSSGQKYISSGLGAVGSLSSFEEPRLRPANVEPLTQDTEACRLDSRIRSFVSRLVANITDLKVARDTH